MKIGLPSSFLPLSVDGQCFTTTYNCTGATKNLESEGDCCLGNGLSYGDGSRCQICYGKHFLNSFSSFSMFYVCCKVEPLPNVCQYLFQDIRNRSLGIFVTMFILVTTQWRADYVWWFGEVTMASLVVQETIISKELLVRHYIIIIIVMLYLQQICLNVVY